MKSDFRYDLCYALEHCEYEILECFRPYAGFFPEKELCMISDAAKKLAFLTLQGFVPPISTLLSLHYMTFFLRQWSLAPSGTLLTNKLLSNDEQCKIRVWIVDIETSFSYILERMSVNKKEEPKQIDGFRSGVIELQKEIFSDIPYPPEMASLQLTIRD